MDAGKRSISFTLNGKPVSAEVGTHQNVVELLNMLALRGTRESCGQGLCGACTVLVDDKAVSGCLAFAVTLHGREVRTIEGLEQDGRLDPVQEAFIEAGAFQCGFCTSGMILMTKKLLDDIPEPSDEQVRDYLSGNLCRCAAYPEILQAVKLAAGKRRDWVADA